MVALIYVIIGLYVASRALTWISESKPVRISDLVLVAPCVVLGWPVLGFVWAAGALIRIGLFGERKK